MSRYVLIFLLAAAATPAQAFQNEPDGFRGLSWGTPLAKAGPGFELTEKGDAQSIYARQGDKLSIGAAQLDYIRYAFGAKGFSSVLIATLGGAANKRALLDALQARFGTPDSSDEILGRYYWVGDRARVGVHCGLRPNCELFIESTHAAEAEQAERRAAAKAAGKDF